MKCNKCGYENLDSVKFCGECGAALNSDNIDHHDVNYMSSMSQKSGKKTGLVLGIVALVMIIIAGSYIVYNRRKNSKIAALHDALVVEEMNDNYSRMAEINQELYNLTRDENYLNEVSRIGMIKEKQEKTEKVQKLIQSEKFAQAYSLILDLDESDTLDLDEMRELTLDFESTLNDRIDKNISSKEYDASKSILNRLLEIDPENEFFLGLLDVSESARKSNQSVNSSKQSQKKVVNNQGPTQLEKTGEGLLGKTIHVTAQTANIRSGPGLSYPIQYSIYKGSAAYVSDYAIGDNLLWVYCGDGWISYKNFDGSLKY